MDIKEVPGNCSTATSRKSPTTQALGLSLAFFIFQEQVYFELTSAPLATKIVSKCFEVF